MTRHLARPQLLTFQEEHPLKFLAFCTLTTAALLHASWTMQRARLIHHDIHPAQILVTKDGRPCVCDLGQCSVIPPDGRKQLLPPLGRRDFCRPAKLSPLQGAEVDGYGVGATLWVTWQGQYDGSNRIDRAWNKHEERDALQQRLERLAARALAQFGAPNVTPPRWPFASTLLKHLRKTTPAKFAQSVRGMIEYLVTACQEGEAAPPGGAAAAPPSPPIFTTFTAETPFRSVLPFLGLDAALATDPDVALEPTNFALPSVRAEDPWPPAESNLVHPVYMHALAQLRIIEAAASEHRSRSRAARPELPELPIPLTAEPCVSMLLHPGRVATPTEDPMVRIAIVSMLVRDALPPEIVLVLRARPWAEGSGGGAGNGEIGGAGNGGAAAGAGGEEPMLVFSVHRDEFLQEGPSGPIEAKRVLSLRCLPGQRTRVTFEFADPQVGRQMGFCATPPMLIDHRPQHAPPLPIQ